MITWTLKQEQTTWLLIYLLNKLAAFQILFTRPAALKGVGLTGILELLISNCLYSFDGDHLQIILIIQDDHQLNPVFICVFYTVN